MRTLGLIGVGMIGGTLARLAVAAGLHVVISNSREPETLDPLVADLGGRARAATAEETALAGDLVVAAIPQRAYRNLPAAALAGKTVIDTTNYFPDRDGRTAALDSGEIASSALVQQLLVRSHVVKAFNNIDFWHLFTGARPAGAADRSALPIAGDCDRAKESVATLLDLVGYDTVDIGELADSWRSEPGMPAYVWPYMAVRPEDLPAEDVCCQFLEAPGVVVPAHKVRELVDSAESGGDRQPVRW
ncbi:NADPH-dependent F420 reductase [Streptomyces sp. NPDC102364]|uniref:NADPH-dependent F420 reductase n=1 Tax=Streptomyces sp. NPDC102364 TaxID=3366161 RepID=UPI0037FA1243